MSVSVKDVVTSNGVEFPVRRTRDVGAGSTVLSLATISPKGLADPSDERLVAAAEGLIASQAAIDQLYREHDYADGYGEVDERADCRALLAVQDQHVETLVTVPATSNAGLQAKASVVAAKFMADGFRPDHKRLAVSLANDLVGGAQAAIPTTPALASPTGTLDPVFGIIEAHRTAQAVFLAALAEQSRLERIGDPAANSITEAPCHAAMDAFNKLIETAPATFAGLAAWASCLDEIASVEAWMVEEQAPTLVATLVEALGNLAVQS
jgi:hypothetical protein